MTKTANTNLFKQLDQDLEKAAKRYAVTKPTTYYHPIIFYKNNYYRFFNGNCFIGNHTRKEKNQSCANLSWFEYDISMDLMIKLEEQGTLIQRKRRAA